MLDRETPSAFSLKIGNRCLDNRCLEAEFQNRVHVLRHRAREAPELGAQTGLHDHLDRSPIVLRHARKPNLDSIDAEPIQETGDLDLLVRGEHETDGLLPITERRVVHPDD